MSRIQTRECSLTELSSGVLQVVQKNLPSNEQILFCYETSIPAAKNFSPSLIYYNAGVITNRWLLTIDMNNNGQFWGGERVCLMEISEIGYIEELATTDGGSTIVKNNGFPEKLARFDFESKYLCYKLQESIQKATKYNYEARQKQYEDEIKRNNQVAENGNHVNSSSLNSNHISISGDVTGSTIIIGNENKLKNS